MTANDDPSFPLAINWNARSKVTIHAVLKIGLPSHQPCPKYLFSAKGAAHFKPRVTPQGKDVSSEQALKARVKPRLGFHSRHSILLRAKETRRVNRAFSAAKFFLPAPGALPQADVRSAPLALNIYSPKGRSGSFSQWGKVRMRVPVNRGIPVGPTARMAVPRC
jgi:hypothetical protein